MPLNPAYFNPRGTWKAKLLTDGFDPTGDWEYIDDIAAYAVSGTNVSDQTLTINATITGPRNSWDIDDIVWTGIICANFGYVIYYLDTGDSSTSPIAHYDDVRDFTDPGNPVGQNFSGDYTHQTPDETLVFLAW